MAAWPPEFEALLRRYLTVLTAHDPLPGGKQLVELGLDSLAMVNLMVDVERSFEVEFPAETLVPETFATTDALWDVLSALTGKAR